MNARAKTSDAGEFEAAAFEHDEPGPASETGPAPVRDEPGPASEPDEIGLASGPEGEQPDAREPATVDTESTDPEADPAEAPSDLAAVIAERDAYLEDLQRVTAEFTNFRRQTMKRNTELVAQAASRLARELLVVLDACEAAVSQGVEGIEAVQSQLLSVLTGEGLAVLGTVDEPFDPGFHEAVMSEMSEESGTDGQSAPVVADVLRTGYAWNGRVLRPAMVKVRS